ILNDKKETYTRSINQFIRTKGEKRDGLTTVGAEAVIPVDRITKPEKQPETVVDLRQHVGRVPVTTGTGSYPILRANKNKMISVAELAKNPALANPEFTKVNYEIETYRGYIPVSQESLDDSDIDLGGLVAESIQRQSLNTSNAEIAAKLQTATAKTVTTIDDLKDIVNVAIDPAYNVKFIASQSFFNELDKMKDNDGRYLLQQDVTVASGYKLLGREVVVMADDVIGKTAGDKVAFVGDPLLFAKYFDRQQASVRWVDNDVYGQLLAGFIRFDVEVADTAAGFYVTLGPKA
ncbi:phage major capsid protein, partial [Enterococcus faecium]